MNELFPEEEIDCSLLRELGHLMGYRIVTTPEVSMKYMGRQLDSIASELVDPNGDPLLHDGIDIMILGMMSKMSLDRGLRLKEFSDALPSSPSVRRVKSYLDAGYKFLLRRAEPRRRPGPTLRHDKSLDRRMRFYEVDPTGFESMWAASDLRELGEGFRSGIEAGCQQVMDDFDLRKRMLRGFLAMAGSGVFKRAFYGIAGRMSTLAGRMYRRLLLTRKQKETVRELGKVAMQFRNAANEWDEAFQEVKGVIEQELVWLDIVPLGYAALEFERLGEQKSPRGIESG